MTQLKKGEMLSRMIVLATNAHAGQFDRGGRPYILHPLAVMQLLENPDEEQQWIAVGHDVVEDCGVTWTQLREAGMSERVIEGIRRLTKIPGQSAEEYEAEVLGSVDSRKVKKADLTHNTDIRRLKGVSPKDIARTAKYYELFMKICAKDAEEEGK